jgi:hypothetical protein
VDLLPGCLPHHQWWVAAPRSDLTASYVRQETRTVTYPIKGGTRHVQAPRKASAEVPNLSKREMCSNYSLNICPRFLQPFTALSEGWAPKALRSQISSSSTSWGPVIDVFNFGGGRCWTLPLAPPRGPAIDVFNFGSDHCRTLSPAPQGPTIDVFNFAGGRCRTLPPAPPGGSPSTSSTSVVAAAGPCNQHLPSTCSTSEVAAAGSAASTP